MPSALLKKVVELGSSLLPPISANPPKDPVPMAMLASPESSGVPFENCVVAGASDPVVLLLQVLVPSSNRIWTRLLEQTLAADACCVDASIASAAIAGTIAKNSPLRVIVVPPYKSDARWKGHGSEPA